MKIVLGMYLWTTKFPLNLVSHPDSGDGLRIRIPDPHRLHLGGALRPLSSLVKNVICCLPTWVPIFKKS